MTTTPVQIVFYKDQRYVPFNDRCTDKGLLCIDECLFHKKGR